MPGDLDLPVMSCQQPGGYLIEIQPVNRLQHPMVTLGPYRYRWVARLRLRMVMSDPLVRSVVANTRIVEA